MDTFGDRLRSEREERGLSISAVAQILRVDQDRVLALERNDFDALPDEAEIVDCLRAYAGCLHVEADLMIEDYQQERRRCLRKLDDAVAEPAAEAVPPVAADDVERRPGFSPWLAVVVLGAVALLVAWWMFSGDGTTSVPPGEPQPFEAKTPTAASTEAPSATAPSAPQPVSPKTPAAPGSVESQAAQPAAPAPSQRRGASSTTRADVTPTPTQGRARSAIPVPLELSVPESGVGTSVENRQLVGRSDRFVEGTQVWFWTRVQGGDRGDRIEHVWLREGVEATRIPLRVGGASWRTYSAKTLHAGSVGDWTVEARDESGHVLARHDFACVP